MQNKHLQVTLEHLPGDIKTLIIELQHQVRQIDRRLDEAVKVHPLRQQQFERLIAAPGLSLPTSARC